MSMMQSEDRQDMTIKNIKNLEKEKKELELAISNSLLTCKQEENKIMALKEAEDRELIMALELSAQEFIENQEKGLNDLENIKLELFRKIKNENSFRFSQMTQEEKEKFNVEQQFLENKKKEFKDSLQENSLLLKKEKKLEKINKKLENELNRLEIEYKEIEAALSKEEQRLEALSPKEPEEPTKVELNKIQLKKPQNFSITELLQKPSPIEEKPELHSKPSPELNLEVQARRNRYLKMKEMIQNRNKDPSAHIEKHDLPSLQPLNQDYSTNIKQEFLKNFK
jgi:hypothetical protein